MPAADPHATRHTLRTVSFGTLLRLLRYPFILLTALIVPRLMGDKVYGTYALFVSLFVLLDGLTDVGITQVFGRVLPELLAQRPSDVPRLLRGLLIFGGALVLVMLALVILPLALLGRPQFPPSAWPALALILLLTRIEGTLFAFLYGKNEIARYSAKELLRSAATLALVVVFFHWFGLPGAFWALVANELVLLVAALFWTGRDLLQPAPPLRLSDLLPHIRLGVTFYLPVLLFSFLQRAGNLFTQALTGSPEQVAYYDVANQYLLLTATFLGLLFTTLLPSLTALYLRGEHAAITRWQRTTMTYCGAAVYAAFAALVLLGRPLLRTVLGADFEPVYPNAIILTAAMPAVLLAYAGMNCALLEKRPSVFAAGTVAAMATMALGCVVLTPRLHAVGTAWATVIGYTALAICFAVRYRREFAALSIGLAALLPAGALLLPCAFIQLPLLAAAGIAAAASLLYLGLLAALHLISWSDARKLWDALRSAPAGETPPR